MFAKSQGIFLLKNSQSFHIANFNGFSFLFHFHLQRMTMDMGKTEINSVTGTSSNPSQISNHQLCAGCGKPIQDRYLLKALDMLWHEDCLKCGCCDCRLGEVGSTLYTKGNLMLCKRDYLRWVIIHWPCRTNTHVEIVCNAFVKGQFSSFWRLWCVRVESTF